MAKAELVMEADHCQRHVVEEVPVLSRLTSPHSAAVCEAQLPCALRAAGVQQVCSRRRNKRVGKLHAGLDKGNGA